MFRVAWMTLALAACGRIGFDSQARGDGDGGVLRLVADRTTANLSSRVSLTVTGGAPPYQFSATDGTVSATGVFRCPGRAATVTLSVIDAEATRETLDIDCGGQQLFLIGGALTPSGIMTDEVLASSDGTTWSLRGHLPTAATYGGCVVYDDSIYYLGGQVMGGALLDTVWRSADGIQWDEVGRIPEAGVSQAIAVHDDAIWIVGAFRQPVVDSASVYRSADGGAWTRLADFPYPVHDAFALTRAGSLYVVGGHFTDLVHRTVDGATWQLQAGRLTISVDDGALGELGDRVVYSSGIDSTSTITNDLLAWAQGPAVPMSKVGAISGFRGRLLLFSNTQIIEIKGSTFQVIGALPRAAEGPRVVQFTPR